MFKGLTLPSKFQPSFGPGPSPYDDIKTIKLHHREHTTVVLHPEEPGENKKETSEESPGGKEESTEFTLTTESEIGVGTRRGLEVLMYPLTDKL